MIAGIEKFRKIIEVHCDRSKFLDWKKSIIRKHHFNTYFMKEGTIMNEEKRKEIEDRLRELVASANKSQDETRPAKSKACGARIIRRRKGSPDRQIV